MQLLYWKNHIPVITPDDIATFNFEFFKILRLLVSLKGLVRPMSQERFKIHNSFSLVRKLNPQLQS